jgi:enoyl-CoA hydratase/carnithine racemase
MDDPTTPADALVLIEHHERVRVVTLNRTDAANAFNGALYHAVADALDAAATDDAISVVVLTGAGSVFSAGADVNDMARGTTAAARERESTSSVRSSGSLGGGFDRFFPALSEFPKPLIAAVNGAAVGIGVTMLLHCDIVLASERARFRLPFTAMGVGPEAGSSVLLPRLLGRQRAARVLYTSEWIDAPGAVAIGLALAVSEPGTLLQDALDLAACMAANPLASLVATKQLLLDGTRDAIVDAVARENSAFGELLGRPGARDRVLGQLDKADPRRAPSPPR